MLSIRRAKDSKNFRKNILYIDKRCYKRDARFNIKIVDHFLTDDTILYIVEKYNIALNKSHVVGYMMCYPDDGYFYLSSLAVLKKYRKDGIGKRLFDKFLREGKKYKSLRLHAVNPIMIHMAESKGFKIIRRNRKYYGKVGAVLMEK